ncbi:MAG: hypothetical protein R3300_12370 [Candidatus Promineifilaceae bacterium]|nr:hypothetical protein [Candidatus Promineifilaceae bacterium]
MRTIPDLEPYYGCGDAELLGLAPLAVGFVRRPSFPTGPTPKGFAQQLLAFCLPEHLVCTAPGPLHCPLPDCQGPMGPIKLGDRTVTLERGELRALGEDDIFAAPSLIYHLVTAHHYRPPPEFIDAVLQGPEPGSAEHRLLIHTLNRGGRQAR